VTAETSSIERFMIGGQRDVSLGSLQEGKDALLVLDASGKRFKLMDWGGRHCAFCT
jgi:hypothetical protein